MTFFGVQVITENIKSRSKSLLVRKSKMTLLILLSFLAEQKMNKK